MSDNLTGTFLGAYLQNLRSLSSLNGLSGALAAINLASGLLFNFNLGGGTDNKFAMGLFTPSSTGAIPQGVISNPLYVDASFSPTLRVKGVSVTTLSAPIINIASFPSIILTLTYTNTSVNSRLSIFSGATMVSAGGDQSSTDLQIFANGTQLTSCRAYHQTDIGTASLTTSYSPSSVGVQTILLKLNLNSGNPSITIQNAYVAIIEN